MDPLAFTYVTYAAAAIGLTGVLARTLHRNGALFLEEVFEDNHALAKAVNSLLVIGFYMLNLGYAFLLFRAEPAATPVEGFEILVSKLGALLVSLGVIHFVNMAVFWKIRRTAIDRNDPPARYTAVVPPPPPAPFTKNVPAPA